MMGPGGFMGGPMPPRGPSHMRRGMMFPPDFPGAPGPPPEFGKIVFTSQFLSQPSFTHSMHSLFFSSKIVFVCINP